MWAVRSRWPSAPSRIGAAWYRATAAGFCRGYGQKVGGGSRGYGAAERLETGITLRTQARGEARLDADIFRYFGGHERAKRRDRSVPPRHMFSGRMRPCADDCPDMHAAQRRSQAALDEAVDDLHAFDVPRGRHDLE